jgi:hypothetical protein
LYGGLTSVSESSSAPDSETDPYLPAHYSGGSIERKTKNKKALKDRFLLLPRQTGGHGTHSAILGAPAFC